MAYVVSMQTVQDIVNNARHQVGVVEADVLLAAFAFFVANDAFIVLPSTGRTGG